MPGFQYQPYDNSGSIAQILGLMQAGAHAHADAARQAADANSRAAQIKAQNSAQLAGSLGSIIANTGQQIAQPFTPEGRMHQMQLDEQKRAIAEDDALRTLFAQGQPKPEDVYRVVGPKRGADIIKGFSALQEQNIKTDDAKVGKVANLTAGILALPEPMQADAYQLARTHLLQLGFKPEDIPEQYSKAFVQQAQQSATTAKDRLEAARAEATAKETGRHNAAMEGRPVVVAPGSSVLAPAALAAMPGQPTGQPVAPIFTAPERVQKPASVQEFEYAKTQGYKGSYEQYQTEDANRRRSIVNVNGPGAVAQGDFDKTGDEFLKTIPKEWRNTVKKIASYDEDPTKAIGMRSGMRDRIMQWVNQMNPGYKSDEFAVRAPTRKAFTTGTQGQQINAINTAIGHIDQITGLADKLQNGGFVPGNAAWNAVQTMFGSDKVTNFDTLKDALAGEVSSVLAKCGATVSGIAEAKQKISGANSPTQLAGYVKTLIPVMGSKLASLDYQYHQAMGAEDSFSALSPESKQILTKHGFDPKHPTVDQGLGDVANGAPTGPKVGERRMISGQLGEWDGKGWKAVKG
jgi:hypothetical protein